MRGSTGFQLDSEVAVLRGGRGLGGDDVEEQADGAGRDCHDTVTQVHLVSQLLPLGVEALDVEAQTGDTGAAEFHGAMYRAWERPRQATPLTGGGAGDMQ